MNENTLLIGLSRQTVLRRELDIVANNIANLNTTGFKSDGAVFAEHLHAGTSDMSMGPLGRRMSFVQDRMTWHDMSQGGIQQTNNPLDVAIEGDGFLVVQTPRGERYTRNGALQVNAQGQLVTSTGYQVMGDAGPILLGASDRDIIINPDGTIRVREAESNADSGRGRLRLVAFANAQRLMKDGSSTFRAPDGMVPQPPADRRSHRAGRDREIQRARGGRDEPHDRAHPRLQRSRQHPAAARRAAERCDRPPR